MISYRAPILLSASLVVLLALHLFVLSPQVKREVTALPFPVEAGEFIQRLEIRRENGEIVEIVRRTLSGGGYSYDIVRPFQKPAEKLVVDGVLRTLSGLTSDHAEARAGVDLGTIGLEPPLATARIETNFKSVVLKFGKEDPATRRGSRFHPYLIEGREEKIHRIFKPYYDELVQEPDRWRTRQLLSVEVALVEEIGLDCPVVEGSKTYQRIEARREEQNRWRLTAPYEERADLKRIGDLLVQIDQLRVAERAPLVEGAMKAHGLEDPRLRVEFRRRGETRPVRLVFGNVTTEVEKSGDQEFTRRKIAVHLDGSDEVALCDGDTIVDILPKAPEDLRPRDMIPYSLNEIDRLEIACHGLGEMVLQAYDHAAPPDPKRGGAPTLRRWALERPHGDQLLEGDPRYAEQQARMEMFVESVRRIAILEYVKRDASLPDLRNPECRVTLHIRAAGGKTVPREYYFEVKEASASAFVRLGESLFERVRVERDMVLKLKKMEYNFYVWPVLEIPVPPGGTLTEVFTRLKVAVRYPGGGTDRFEVKRNESGKWASDRTGKYLLDDNRLGKLLQHLVRLVPIQIMSRNPADLPIYGLSEPYLDLEIGYEQDGIGRTRRLRISERARGNLVFATLDANPLIFQVHPDIAESIEQLHTRPYEGHDPTKFK
jgi:hypothetical protein